MQPQLEGLPFLMILSITVLNNDTVLTAMIPFCEVARYVLEFPFHLQANVVSNDSSKDQECHAYRDVCNSSLVSTDQPHMVGSTSKYDEVQKKRNLKSIQVPAFVHPPR